MGSQLVRLRAMVHNVSRPRKCQNMLMGGTECYYCDIEKLSFNRGGSEVSEFESKVLEETTQGQRWSDRRGRMLA